MCCVNWFEIEIVDGAGKTRARARSEVTYRNSFITDLPVDASNVSEFADCGRARWKIENETFNVLKTERCNFEHNFGHGKENLSAVLATLNLLAFAMHAVFDITVELWRLARQKLVTRGRFFNMIADAAALMYFPSWDEFLRTSVIDAIKAIPDWRSQRWLFGTGSRRNIARDIKAAAARPGVSSYGSHAVGRHKFASSLLAEGKSLHFVKDAGRWATIKMVSERYGHLEQQQVTDDVNASVSARFGSRGCDGKMTGSGSEEKSSLALTA